MPPNSAPITIDFPSQQIMNFDELISNHPPFLYFDELLWLIYFD